MWHIFKNSTNQFEVAFVTKGRFQVGSNQGYARKSGALSVLKSIVKNVHDAADGGKNNRASLLWQDDTLATPKTFWEFSSGCLGCEADVKPVKKYVPQQRRPVKKVSFR